MQLLSINVNIQSQSVRNLLFLFPYGKKIVCLSILKINDTLLKYTILFKSLHSCIYQYRQTKKKKIKQKEKEMISTYFIKFFIIVTYVICTRKIAMFPYFYS